jgi:Ca2+-transporting ATPase
MSHHLTGLNAQQVEESRLKYGSNILTPAKKESLWITFLKKFSDPLIIILLIAGVLSILISFYEYYGLDGEYTVFFEPIGIFVAIFLATGLSFFFEYQAEKEFAILNQVNDDEPVQVIRSGNSCEIPRKEVVVGDIVILNTGVEVPADGELIEATSLNIDESTLTGEPICHKSVNPEEFDPEATFPTNHALRGTKVMEGHGIMEVTAVGDRTENGKVFEAAQIDDSVKTPLSEQLDRLGKLVSYGSYAVGVLIVIGRVLMYFLQPGLEFSWLPFITYVLQTLMIAVTLVVVAVPEGLPMAVTLSLAYSMRRMIKTNNLVRKMHACETMGATTVICTDKTGTLTCNQMQIYQTDFYGLKNQQLTDDEESHLIAEGIAVNSTAMLDLSDAEKPKALGNPTEGALLLWLNKNGVDYKALKEQCTVVEELPFTTQRKYMATVVSDAAGRRILYVKGAPEIVYGLCSRFPAEANKAAVDARLLEYQQKAMRTLGFAYQILEGEAHAIVDGRVAANALTFLGFVAISDPVRSDVPAAIKETIDAGIQIKIVTGDTPGTAREIGRQIGLWNATDTDRNIITGPEFEQLSDSELRERCEDIKIIARARPLDKKRLVEALQANNEVVAVTGDGTNDAPALKTAHVGLSMGDGTSVAKEASDITIVDNSFASISRAVMWGRSLYRNIQRFVMFQLTVNVAACLIVLAGAFMGTESPLTVTQMLWVNLIMDTFAAMALASLPPDYSVMKNKPRKRSAFIITRPMYASIVGIGIFFFAMLLGLLWYFEHTEVESLTQMFTLPIVPNNGLSPYELSLFFTIFVFLQFWNMFNARAFATGRSALHFANCGEFVFIISAIFFGQIIIIELGNQFFNVVPLKFVDWVIIVASTSIVLWAGELYRLFSTPKR